VKSGRLDLVEDYCMLGHAAETSEETLPLAIQHGGLAMVRFLLDPPQDAPVTPRAFRLAVDWTMEHGVSSHDDARP
jgi:hypothetical protein